MAKAKKLVAEHLEKISWEVLGEYPDVVSEMISGRAGVYALYRRDRLYYVRLASDLRSRLRTHLRDRHGNAWDRFSVYLTEDSDHIKELESLLLRIASPRGNKQGGKFIASLNLSSDVRRRIKDKDDDRRAKILGGATAKRRRRSQSKRNKRSGSVPLAGLVERAIRLKATYRGYEYTAMLRKNGLIQYDGYLYESPSDAARSIVGRRVSGWSFWKYRNRRGEWVPVRDLRR